jgi:anti-anti-sigma regulatory factor
MHTGDAGAGGGGERAAGAPHWHLIGAWWRPLHEQVEALRDAALWIGAVGRHSSGKLAREVGAGTIAMTVSVTRGAPDFAAVTVSGPLDPRTVHYLGGQLRLLLDVGVHDLVVDLAEVTRCDLRFAAVLLTLHARLHARHGTLVLANPPPEVRQALAVGRLPDSFMHCPGQRVGGRV